MFLFLKKLNPESVPLPGGRDDDSESEEGRSSGDSTPHPNNHALSIRDARRNHDPPVYGPVRRGSAAEFWLNVRNGSGS